MKPLDRSSIEKYFVIFMLAISLFVVLFHSVSLLSSRDYPFKGDAAAYLMSYKGDYENVAAPYLHRFLPILVIRLISADYH